jgi:hypothetical protein
VAYTDRLVHSASPDAAAPVIEAFTRARLLPREQDKVEIAHEVLLRAWPRLREWIDADRPGNQLRQKLEGAATNWERTGRDTSLLYRGSRLDTALAWAATARSERPTPTASAFLAAGHRQQRRATVLRRAVIGILPALTLIASSAAVIAFQQRAAARSETKTTVFNQLQGEADGLRSTQLPLAAQIARRQRGCSNRSPVSARSARPTRPGGARHRCVPGRTAPAAVCAPRPPRCP